MMRIKALRVKAIRYNNAGIECFQSLRLDYAWELFKGALEMNLVCETLSDELEGGEDGNNSGDGYVAVNGSGGGGGGIIDGGTDTETETDADTSAVYYNEHIQFAEYRLQNLSSYVTHQPQTFDRQRLVNELEQQQGFGVTEMSILFEPYLCSNPFSLPEDASVSQLHDIQFSRSMTAVIIYNLALLNQVRSRSSRQVMSLYELSTSLLVNNENQRVSIAIINNIGVWCFDNGDNAAAQRCMEHLSKFVSCIGGIVSDDEREGIQRNILWILNPPFTVSPAA
jgi:hypothetical protein